MSRRGLYLVCYRGFLGQWLKDDSRYQGGPLKTEAGSVAETAFHRESHGEWLLWASTTAVSGRQKRVSIGSGSFVEVRMVAVVGRK